MILVKDTLISNRLFAHQIVGNFQHVREFAMPIDKAVLFECLLDLILKIQMLMRALKV